MHVVHLKDYLAAIKRCTPTDKEPLTHVCVPFANDSDPTTAAHPMEVLWEGRAFDDGHVWDPQEYPHSLYKSLHVVWYRALARDGKANKNLERWVFDEEQTDNFQSPWDTLPSKMHNKWSKAHPDLASITHPRAKRGVFKPNAIVEAPESMAIDEEALKEAGGDVEQEAITRTLKRLLSNEAAGHFFHPVPSSEVAYHQTVEEPICLSEISDKHSNEAYPSYAAFEADLDKLISNSFLFNHEDTLHWIGTCMLNKDLTIVRDELKAAGHQRILLSAGKAAATGDSDEDDA